VAALAVTLAVVMVAADALPDIRPTAERRATPRRLRLSLPWRRSGRGTGSADPIAAAGRRPVNALDGQPTTPGDSGWRPTGRWRGVVARNA
jgi:hypothetical protein